MYFIGAPNKAQVRKEKLIGLVSSEFEGVMTWTGTIGSAVWKREERFGPKLSYKVCRVIKSDGVRIIC